MAYYFDGIKCDTLAELDALRARKSGHAPAKTVEVKPIKLTDEQALKIALGGEPKYPTRATHPEDKTTTFLRVSRDFLQHDDERDYQEDLRRYAAAKDQVRNAVSRGKRDPDEGYRHIPD